MSLSPVVTLETGRLNVVTVLVYLLPSSPIDHFSHSILACWRRKTETGSSCFGELLNILVAFSIAPIFMITFYESRSLLVQPHVEGDLADLGSSGLGVRPLAL